MQRRRSPRHNILTAVMATLLLVFSLCSVTGCCRPTDVLKEIVMDQNATIVDTNNRVTVNTPYATKESSKVPTLEMKDKATSSKEKQNIVVYGKKTNSMLATPHSIFDISPKFRNKTVESSDAVKLVASDSDTAIDHAVDDGDSSSKAASTKNSGKTKQSKSDTKKKGSSGAKQGKSSKKDSGKKGSSGKGSHGKGSKDSGDTDSGSGGYGATKTYVPGEEVNDPPTADSIAAIGQAAVMVQAIGGEGALCGMDTDTYDGGDRSAKNATASTFKAVFGDELEEGFAKDALLWKGDGTKCSDIKDIDSLVSACGQGGVIVVSSDDIDYKTYFTKKQAEKIDAAGITVVPVSFASAQGIEEAATAIGKILKDSTKAAQNENGNTTTGNAKKYRQIFDGIISACADATNDGKLAPGGGTSGNTNTTDGAYYAWNGGFSSSCHLALIATDFDKGATYKNNTANSLYDGIDISDGILFTHPGCYDSPLSLFMQSAGLGNAACTNMSKWAWSMAGGTADSTVPLWQFGLGGAKSDFKGYASDSPFAHNIKNALSKYCSASVGMDIGNSGMPYLIVCNTKNYTGTQVKKNVVASSKKNGVGAWGAYDCQFPGDNADIDGHYEYIGYDGENGEILIAAIGGYRNDDGQPANILLDNGITSLQQFIRINPTGLLSKWTDGSAESVLESVWLTQVYSESTATYTPSYKMSDFSVKIGDTTCTSAEQAIEAFYATVYRCPTSQHAYKYSDVVTDE